MAQYGYDVAHHEATFDVDVVPNYPVRKSPTSGWVVIHDCLKTWDEVITVGFDLASASYYKRSKIHACDYEIQELNNLWESGKVTRHYGRAAA